jgi:ectoine hydroxylase-related dioxygenase (phytanoyl-CoA dioxygenase family)
MFTRNIEKSWDMAPFEVQASFDGAGGLSAVCLQQALDLMDRHGFVVINDVLDGDEAAAGLELVLAQLRDPERERATFASETDVGNQRRDFCPLPSTEPVLAFSGLVCSRIADLLTTYTSPSRAVLEISTLTSYLGCSHQYLHRDPAGAICVFIAVADVSPEQGGTVFVPGTHRYIGSAVTNYGASETFMTVFQDDVNQRLFRYNLRMLWDLYQAKRAGITRRELRDRVWSRLPDKAQPNIRQFLTCKNSAYDLTNYRPRSLLLSLRYRRFARGAYDLVQVSPRAGSVVVYRSDMLHAGPDNRSTEPRYVMSLTVARDTSPPDSRRFGYTPHSTLIEDPKTLADLIAHGERAPQVASAGAARSG